MLITYVVKAQSEVVLLVGYGTYPAAIIQKTYRFSKGKAKLSSMIEASNDMISDTGIDILQTFHALIFGNTKQSLIKRATKLNTTHYLGEDYDEDIIDEALEIIHDENRKIKARLIKR